MADLTRQEILDAIIVIDGLIVTAQSTYDGALTSYKNANDALMLLKVELNALQKLLEYHPA